MSIGKEQVTFAWVSGVLLTILLGLAGWTARTAAADIDKVKTDLSRQEQYVALRVQTLDSQIAAVRDAQRRQMDLLKKIATRMGIEVAE